VLGRIPYEVILRIKLAPFFSLRNHYIIAPPPARTEVRRSLIQIPAADIAPPVRCASHGDHGTVGLKPHRVILACGDIGDVCPILQVWAKAERAIIRAIDWT